MQVASAELSDSLWPWNSPEEVKFSKVSSVILHPSEIVSFAPPETIVSFVIRLDDQSTIYTRKVYSFMNLLQDLGGFVNSVLVGGRIIMFVFID